MIDFAKTFDIVNKERRREGQVLIMIDSERKETKELTKYKGKIVMGKKRFETYKLAKQFFRRYSISSAMRFFSGAKKEVDDKIGSTRIIDVDAKKGG